MLDKIPILIKARMIERGYKQRDLAKEIGKSRSWVSTYLKYIGDMSLSDFLRICKILKIKITIGEN